MISFLLCVGLLVCGYLFYGKFVDKSFGPDDRKTPAIAMTDGVDYVPLKGWNVFLIQILNIAGTGPIFGALGGACFGPIVYLWIILGCIFAGGVHDYMCGMLSVRHKGANIPEITGFYLGKKVKVVMRVFSVILLVMCGVVFTTGSAGLINILTGNKIKIAIWIGIILVYFFIATFLPVDKVIGRIYPFFGICLLTMTLGVSFSLLFSGNYNMPELWNNFSNQHAHNTNVFPFMFITVACGAISGFHATQTPLMARCIKSEQLGRPIFYGSMVVEGVIALVWAAAGVSCYESSQALLDAGAGCSAVVYHICQSTMGKVGCFISILGVIVCPITSGDTAFRSARLIISETFHIDQTNWKKRLYTTIPLLTIGGTICTFDYSIIWRYFSWSNQTLATIVLWTACVYFVKNNKNYYITLIPALFMTVSTSAYFVSAPECLGLIWNKLKLSPTTISIISTITGLTIMIIFLTLFLLYPKKHPHKHRLN